MFFTLVSCAQFGLALPEPVIDTPGEAMVELPAYDVDISDTSSSEGSLDTGSSGGDSGGSAAEVEPPDDPSATGPYAVGVRTVELWDASRWRPIPVEVWYPSQGDGGQNSYDIELLGLELYTINTPAGRDATPLGGPWPVVSFSHGYGGLRFQSYFLTEHLASHGFVVVAPDHMGNTLLEPWNLGSDEAAYQSSVDRPLDMAFVLDALLAGDLGSDLEVDEDRVGITGHSFGGWTSIQAPLDDPRYVASFPMAPGFKETATPEMTAGLGIPLFIFGGSEDATCEFEENQVPAYEAALPSKYLAEVVGAGHLDFSNLCEIELATLFIDDGCDDEKIDPADVQARTRTLSVAFAKVFVADDLRYADFLDPVAVEAMGSLEFWAVE